MIMDCWVMPYGTPACFLTDNGPKRVATFFASVWAYLGMKQLTTTAYQPQTNGQTDRYNKTIAARSRNYMPEHQNDWEDLFQPLTYAFNAKVNSSTNCTPRTLLLSRQQPGPTTLLDPTALPHDLTKPPTTLAFQ